MAVAIATTTTPSRKRSRSNSHSHRSAPHSPLSPFPTTAAVITLPALATTSASTTSASTTTTTTTPAGGLPPLSYLAMLSERILIKAQEQKELPPVVPTLMPTLMPTTMMMAPTLERARVDHLYLSMFKGPF